MIGRFQISFTLGVLITILAVAGCEQRKPESTASKTDDLQQFRVQRAKQLELNTTYRPPPGDPLLHHAAGYAKILCSAVFVSGLNIDFAAEHLGYFTAPYEQRQYLKYTVDSSNQTVEVTLPNGIIRTAKFLGDLGCTCLPIDATEPNFVPSVLRSDLPPASETYWPMGDLISPITPPARIDTLKVQEAIALAFQNAQSKTAALVITHNGNIIGEQYAEGINMHTSLESWSMGKSLSATLMGVMIQQGIYTLDQPAPIPEWLEDPEDPRSQITIANILNMSSGLRFRAPRDPDFDPSLGYPDHLYVYTGTVNSFSYCANLQQQWPPNTVGRYRNCDPVLINYLIRLGVEKMGLDYHSFPTRFLFDPLGIRNMILETDPYGNFLLQGYELGSARDWARLGNLYLQDGMWNGERVLPEGYTDFISTLAPTWKADRNPIYGGFFWINGDGLWTIPKEAYYMAGAGGQFTIIIPSHDLVVVRLGHYSGQDSAMRDLDAALIRLLEAVQ